jgi:4-amino-4-deoxy-L-arabinose transferase-like glycosyltransferase
MLGSSPAFLVGGQYINHDMLVASWISTAIWCFAIAFLHGEKPHKQWAIAGFAACALGVLSKGLIGLALPGLVLLIWLIWTRQFGKIWSLPWGYGLAIFILLTVPWFVFIERKYPGALAYLFGVQQFSRYVGSGFNNARAWWFYLPCIALLLLPWIFFTLLQGVTQVRDWWQRKHQQPNADSLTPTSTLPPAVLALCWIWVIAILVFFSIPRSKLIGYMLPVTSPLVVIAAIGFMRWPGSGRGARATLASLYTLMPIVILAVSIIATLYFTNLVRSAKGIAQVLACNAAPNDAVYVYDSFPYDLPLYAGLNHPLIAVQDWPQLRITAGDNWQRELFEAGNFELQLAERLLQSWPDALKSILDVPGSWVVTPKKFPLDSHGLQEIANVGYWSLYASPVTAAALASKSPKTTEHKSLPGC